MAARPRTARALATGLLAAGGLSSAALVLGAVPAGATTPPGAQANATTAHTGLGQGSSRRPAALHAGTPLTSALTKGGTLKAGVEGSFSARGYRMVLGPHGAPRFMKAGGAKAAANAATATSDTSWSNAFGDSGTWNAGSLDAVAAYGQKLYIGGSFSSISPDSGLTYNNVAEWDGSGWVALGTTNGTGGHGNGTNNEVFALALSSNGSTVYAGGSFNSAGGAAANAVAAFSTATSTWSPLGTGMSDPRTNNTPTVQALAVSGSTLYAAGQFDEAGSDGSPSIGAWNGSAWSALGTGVQNCVYFPSCTTANADDGTVNALAVSGSNLYVGGAFNYPGGKPIDGLAVWNGSAWSALGGSVESNNSNGLINSIALSGGLVYVAGTFDTVGASFDGNAFSGGVPAASVAEWTGYRWTPLGSGAQNCNGCGNATVYSVAAWSSKVYISGSFYGAGGDGQPHTAVWNGSTWGPVGPNLDGSPERLVSSSRGVVAAGGFTDTADQATVLNNLGLWNGAAWSGFGLGISYGGNAGSVGVLGAENHTLVAGGNFYTAGWTAAHNLAEFNGTSWSTMGGGLGGGAPYAIAINGNDVYVGGSFSQAGTTGAANIAMWDGHSWHALGSGVAGTVYALTMYNGKLWVGGSFTGAGAVKASDVAIWNPANSTWSAVGGDLHYDGTVNALSGLPAPYNHYMAIGGSFSQVDDGSSSPNYVDVNSIVFFDTSKAVANAFSGYYTLGSAGTTDVGVTLNSSYGPFAGSVSVISSDGTKWYVGGDFDNAGDVASRAFAVFDANATGDAWSSPGPASNGSTVDALEKVGTAWYVGGSFSSIGGVIASGIAEYQPASKTWSALGSGLVSNGWSGPTVSAIAESADGLYVGGSFGLSGGKPAENLALWKATAYQLEASQTVSPATQTADSTVTFTGAATNSSTAAMNGVYLKATLPSNAINVSETPSQGTCSVSGRAVSCTIGTLAVGAKATVAMVVRPIQPLTATNLVTVGQTGQPDTNVVSTTANVRAATNTSYAAVSDTGISSASTSLPVGGAVQYDFYGPAAHSMVVPLLGWTSGTRNAISDAVCRLSVAGGYIAEEDAATTHVETLWATDKVSAASVPHGTAVTVTMATAALPSGDGIDLQVLAPGGSWTTIASGTTALTNSYTPGVAGTYQFRSRLRNLTSNAASSYSPAVSLKAT